MKVTFFSNYLNHHQLPFCLEMKKILNDNFKFVATERISLERINLGYEDMNSTYDFVVRAYENEKEAYELALNSDVVIIGSAPTKYINKRLKNNKLTFRYSERIFKGKFSLKKWLSLIKNFSFKEKNVYLLCASAYTSYDFNIAFSYINRSYKWGYFPKVYEYDIDKLLLEKEKNQKIEILWVGRFLDWKHPEKVIEIAKRLKKQNKNFLIKMIGIGPMFDEIKKNIELNNLQKNVELLGSMNNEQVRECMKKANIYIFTSDSNEGWGAVLNEAMNSGCAIVASHEIGSVPFLMNNYENGLIYINEDIEDLYDKIKLLIDDKNLRLKYGRNAYYTMTKYWNAKLASQRFIELVNSIVNNNKITNKIGPLSKATFLTQNIFKKKVKKDKYD